jgi:DNA invertase Pin-like site-specific DNA recombinase
MLAPIRLSHKTDASLNPAGQRARISEYAEDNEITVIWCDVDMDVSGAVPIRERPGFGLWLAPDRITQIDGFLGDEMDRLSRNMRDYLGFVEDMMKLGKIIIDVSDGTDTSTERGREILEDRVLVAQRERTRMMTRRHKAHVRARTAGRWDGGVIPFGYEPRCDCHGVRRCPVPEHTAGWHLFQGPNAVTAKWMIQVRIAGKGFAAIAGELTVKKVPTSRGQLHCDCHNKRRNSKDPKHRCPDPGNATWHDAPWTATAVQKILTSPILLGYQIEMKNGVPTVRRGKDGLPIPFTDEPIIEDRETWDLLQDAIKAGSRARGLPQSRHLLYRVFFCRTCSPQPFSHGTAVIMYGNRRYTGAGSDRHTKDHREYYNCKSCGLNVRLDKVEPLVKALIMREVGERVLLERRVIHGDDHAAAISRLERAAERRRELLADDPDDEDMKRSLTAMEAQIADLRRMPHEPDTTEWREVESGITVAQHWESLDTGGRAKFLRDWEVTVLGDRDGAEITLGWLQVYTEAFKLADNRLAPAALPALITHSRDWQRVSGAPLPAVVAQAIGNQAQA